MTSFQALRDVAINFENYSRQVSAELISVKISKPFEDVVDGKLRDVKLFTSKYRFLEAKSLADTPKICETSRSEQTILDYEDTMTSKIIEQLVVKSVTQTHTVQNLMTTHNHKLKPEFVETKEKIIKALTEYNENESVLHLLEGVLEKKEDELLEAQRRWDHVVGRLKDTPKVTPSEEPRHNGPLHKRLQTLTNKLDQMRWLISTLVTSRYDQDYDWSFDPDRRLRALAIARKSTNERE